MLTRMQRNANFQELYSSGVKRLHRRTPERSRAESRTEKHERTERHELTRTESRTERALTRYVKAQLTRQKFI